MAATKSLVSLVSWATLLFVIVTLVARTHGQPYGPMGQIVVAQQSQSCSAQLGDLNLCAPFVLPGAVNPSAECCNALQAVGHECLCNTIRVSTRLPTQCNLPSISCAVN
ncbi:stamen-specific protein FIL1-like [Actinidia eriantha]|uniref:stamen-specific protein FIL1-like n=1 Tax=Actinidia eriantha TaxID=165200 RepID=UPI00258C24FF|nr:stamen-specific protein FIL1-like [Actinidia eriantha]